MNLKLPGYIQSSRRNLFERQIKNAVRAGEHVWEILMGQRWAKQVAKQENVTIKSQWQSRFNWLTSSTATGVWQVQCDCVTIESGTFVEPVGSMLRVVTVR